MRSLALAGLLLLWTAAPAMAQRGTAIRIELPPPAARLEEGPRVRATRVLSDSRLRDLLRNGFPARLHWRVEVWSTRGWFDDLKGTVEWDIIVRYEPLERRYEMVHIDADGNPTPLGRTENFANVEAIIERPQEAPILPPRRRDRVYYTVALDVEMLSVSDLDEVERWLRGELRPAVRGQRNPGTAVTRGVRTVVARLLGAEKRHYEERSGRFDLAP
ncbi:MAG TPA: DUF4390 domain-containing protein [Gemmatimonadaceae bacterium]|nr:DUF4390 domain-containing protein [Gemmatimonadaceae bacterium]